jgi:hypothetical protein
MKRDSNLPWAAAQFSGYPGPSEGVAAETSELPLRPAPVPVEKQLQQCLKPLIAIKMGQASIQTWNRIADHGVRCQPHHLFTAFPGRQVQGNLHLLPRGIS